MTKLLDEAIAEVRELPEAEQNAAAGALIDYLASTRDLTLSDEQLAEVRRRRIDSSRMPMSFAEVQARLCRPDA